MVSTSYLIKFGADSKSVSSSIKGIQSEMRALNATSRNLQTSFKYTADTKILDSQLKVLGQQLDLAKQKSALLKDQLNTMSKAEGFDSTSKGAQNLRNQIMRADSEVTKFQSQIARTNSLKMGDGINSSASQVSRSLRGAGDSADDMGRRGQAGFNRLGSSAKSGLSVVGRGLSTANVALGSFLGNLGSMAVGAGFNAIGRVFDGLGSEIIESSDALDKFNSTMKFAGKNSAEVDKVRTASKKYADDTVYDLTTILNTTAQLASNGVDNYEKLMEASGNLNAVAGGNADTFKSVSMVLTQTAGAGKLTTENWNQLADAIPGASGRLQDAMKKNGAYTGNFRDAMADGQISAEEFNKAIMQLGFEDTAKRAATSTDTIEGAYGNLQASFVTAGTEFLDKFKGPITQGMTDVANAVPKLTEGFGNFLSGLPSIFEGAGKVLEPLKSSVSQSLGPLFDAITQNWQSGLNGFGGWIGSFFSGVVQNITALFGGIHLDTWAQGIMAQISGTDTSEATKALSDPINGLNNSASNVNLSPVMAALGSLKDFAKGVGDVLGNIDLTPLFSALGGVVNSFVTSIGSVDFKSITDPLSNAMGTISNGLKGLDFSGIQDFVSAILPAVSEGVKNFLDWVTPAVGPLIDAFKNLWNSLQPVLKILADSLGPAFQVVGDILGGFVSGVMQGITTAFNILAGVIKALTPVIQFIGTIFNALAPILGTVGGWIANLVGQFEGFSGVFGTIGKLFSSVWGGITTFFSETVGPIFSSVMGGIKGGFSAVGDVFSAVGGALKGIFDGMNKAFGGVGSWFADVAGKLGKIPGNIIGFFKGIGGKIAGFFGDAPGKILSFFKGIVGKIGKHFKNIGSIGKNVVKGIWNGISGMGSWLWNNIQDWANGIVKNIKKAFGIHSPSKVMRDEVGTYITKGVGVGMIDEAGTLKKSAGVLKNTIVTSFGDPNLNAGIGLSGSGVGSTANTTTSNNNLTFNISGGNANANAEAVRRVLRQERLI